MKTYLTYGFVMALAGAVLAVVLYLLGLHSDPTKLGVAQLIGTVGILGIGIVCITLGIKARRAELPATDDFTYGQAFGGGFMISLFGALVGVLTNFLYITVINPGFSDVIVQAEVAKLEAKGMSATQIEGAEKIVRMMTGPGMYIAMGFVMGLLIATIISLIVAAFLKRPAVMDVGEAPPSLI
jgi:hypothetical protein